VVSDTLTPDLDIFFALNLFAPRLARHSLRELGHLGPDLRDAVTLLTSDLVTRAVRGCLPDTGAEAHLSAWLPRELVRVELRVPRALLRAASDADHAPYERTLLDQVADRWSIDDGEQIVCMWFEIDRG
jgi:hypothetical protein